ncbi:MAG: RNB domain-containing ribonuclease [Betaproteobacteria bacterium]|nr:RNB domain-containing ribonuclease [Betaproteobacteria bacterium]
MHLLYEEDGELKVGTVLAAAAASYQIESPHGRRSKIKAANVLLSFESPAAAQLLLAAQAYAAELDVDFLWQCAGSAEFGYADLAREYVGREPTPVEAAGALLKLHGAPMYFYRRGRGRFQAAPAETLKAALSGLERKRVQAEKVAEYAERLARGEFPPELAGLRDELLYKPDRNRFEAKAVDAACKQTGLSVARLFERAGALPSSHEYHLNRFLAEFFPAGTGFPPHELPTLPDGLPLAESPVYSLDDTGTTEIDDAFSVRRVSEDEWRIGVHIAAPALGFAPGSALDGLARERLSTVYMPGHKITMLPDDVVAAFSLDEGSERPALSLYFNVSAADLSIRGHHSRIERVRVARNLRHADYEALNALLPAGGRAGLEYEEELGTLWRFAKALEARRGKPSIPANIIDYNFSVENDRVNIVPRLRGAPLDKLVSELMILANSTWGGLLAERDVAALYRVQSSGKVRMSVHGEMHEGLGVSCYAWMSSPLRRYVDLVNQWQLAASLAGKRVPFARNSDTLLAALRAFEVVYARYDENQREMERYWCLRWLQQEGVTRVPAQVLRENLVRVEGLPMTLRVPSLPELPPGARVLLEMQDLDLLEKSVTPVWRETLSGNEAVAPAEDPQDGA